MIRPPTFPRAREPAPRTLSASEFETAMAARRRGRQTLLIAWAVAFAFFLFQPHYWGQVVFNTKLDLTVDPTGLMASLWHVWIPNRYLGTLQDQYIGYAWPMGPFFVAGHWLHFPMWLVQRLWMATVITAAFWGMLRLAEEIGVGTPTTRVFTGTAYALWPTYTALVGSTSSAILPGVMLPWVLLPLAKGARGGSPLKAALWSGVAITFMSGINATVTLDGLILPALFLLTREPGPRRRALMGWWVLAVVLATAWWVIPLLFLGGYGFNFLPFIEQAHTTTSTMSATEVLRGAGNWTAYLDFGTMHNTDLVVLAGGGNPNPALDLPHPWIPAGWVMATYPLAIIASAVLPVLGLGGIARRDMPERNLCIWTIAIGIAFTLAGWWGSLAAPFHNLVMHELDTTFAPLRNVYKFEPIMAVAMGLGLAHLTGGAELTARVHWRPSWRIRRSTVFRLAVGCLLVPLSSPYLTGKILQQGSFAQVPAYWYRLAAYIAKVSPHDPVLVIPASAHGVYNWGSPIDEPLEPLATSPWTMDDQVPFGGAGVARYLDAIENDFKHGVADPGMAAYLQRAGITYLVVRNDVDWEKSDSPSPAEVHSVLDQLGYVRVAAFGPNVPSQDFLTAGIGISTPPAPPMYPSLEVYAPGSLAGTAPSPYPVTTYQVANARIVSGGPEDLLTATGQGLLGDQAAILAGDAPGSGLDAGAPATGASTTSAPTTAASPVWIDTDGLRYAQVNFGSMNDNTSYTLTAGEPAPAGSPGGQGGNPPRQILPFPSDAHQTVATFTGIRSVRASSYGSWFFTLAADGPDAAFDGRAGTAWTTGDFSGPAGQWIQVNFDAPIAMAKLSVSMLDDHDPLRPVPTALTVTTAAGSLTERVADTNAPQTLDAPHGTTSFCRITIAAARGGETGGPGAGIREIGIPGVHAQRWLVAPHDVRPGRGWLVAYSFSTHAANPDATAGAPYPQLARLFQVPGALDVTLRGTALPVPGVPLDRLTRPPGPLQAFTDSVFAGLPRFAISNLLDPSNSSAWIASTPDPKIVISWGPPRTIDELDLTFTHNFAARPESVHIFSTSGSRDAIVPASGKVRFAPLTTNAILISFPKVQKIVTVNHLTGELGQLPLGLTGISLPALAGLASPPAHLDSPVSIPCGQGPPIRIDGTTYRTALTGTYGDLVLPRPLTLRVCGLARLHLGAGRHSVLATSQAEPFAVTSLTLAQVGLADSAATAASDPASVVAPSRAIHVTAWGAENRGLTIGTGPAAYLEIHENFNKGWRATLDGSPLQPVVLDGWQQGFLVPAGHGGTIVLTFVPLFLYRISVAAGAAAAGALFIAALFALFGRPRRREDSSAPCAGRRPARAGWLFAAACAVLFLAGGVTVLLVLAFALVFAALEGPRTRARHHGARPWIAAASMAVAGLVAAWHPGLNAYAHTGAFSTAAEWCALAAVAAVLTPAFDWWAPLATKTAAVRERFRRGGDVAMAQAGGGAGE